jgi:DNA replication licensing factor MCM3
MGENDRVAIHEAMEQQTVTIAKAGIHASLNARCSVLAAANPVYGQYDRSRRIQENIGLPDSLLSRFDLLFVVLDQMDPELDRLIASHVIRGHRSKVVENDCDEDSDDDGEIQASHSIWQRTSFQADDDDTSSDSDDPFVHCALQLDFLRKYLHYAKTRIQPVLTESARDLIAARYAEMRARQDDRTIPITARSLETVIRLATAHAKARLSNTVSMHDCEVAMDILSFALYHEQSITNDLEVRQRAVVTPVHDDDQMNTDGDKRSIAFDEGSDTSDGNIPKKRPKIDELNINDRKQQIWESLESDDEGIAQSTLLSILGMDANAFQLALSELENEGRLMVTNGTVYKT